MQKGGLENDDDRCASPGDRHLGSALTRNYYRRWPAHYPNGRFLTDDAFSVRLAFLTHGQVISDGLKPHDDLLTEFPFARVPHVEAPDSPALTT